MIAHLQNEPSKLLPDCLPIEVLGCCSMPAYAKLSAVLFVLQLPLLPLVLLVAPAGLRIADANLLLPAKLLTFSSCCACRFWGWFFAVTTLLVWLFKREDNFQPTGDHSAGHTCAMLLSMRIAHSFQVPAEIMHLFAEGPELRL